MANGSVSSAAFVERWRRVLDSFHRTLITIRNWFRKISSSLKIAFLKFSKTEVYRDLKFFVAYGALVNFSLAVLGVMRFGVLEILACGIAFWFVKYEVPAIIKDILRGR